MMRTPSSIEMMLPASVPSSRRAAPSRIVARARPTIFSEPLVPASATLSVTRISPPLPRASNASRSIAGCTWTPSGMIAGIARDWRECGGDDSGIAMVQRAHRIEQMREHPRAGVDAGIRLVEGRVGMADGNDHVARGKSANRVDCSRQLGRERDQSKRAHREHSLEGVAARLEVELGDARRGGAAR